LTKSAGGLFILINIKSQNATKKKDNSLKENSCQEGGDEMIVYITTCSMVKKGRGYPITDYNWDYKAIPELLRTRKMVMETMKSGLEKPVEGPDFGGGAGEGLYLRAFKRYGQGDFMSGLESSGADLENWVNNNQLFFISALYGLVHSKEPIQNYDLELSNEISEEWKKSNVVTKALQYYLNQLWNHQIKIDCIVDCCCNIKYSNLIDWPKFSRYGIRHVVALGDFQPRQTRWASGYLAGEDPQKILELVNDEQKKYQTANAVIKLSKELPKGAVETGLPLVEVPAAFIKNNRVAVACLKNDQYTSFMNFAKNHGWDKCIEFRKIMAINKETIKRLDSEGFKILIAHVDAPHKTIRSAYGFGKHNFGDILPGIWQLFKVRHNSYSGLEFELALNLQHQTEE